MTALDIVPLRVLGDMDEPITEANAHLPAVRFLLPELSTSP